MSWRSNDKVQNQAFARRDGQDDKEWTTHQRQGRRKSQGAELKHCEDCWTTRLATPAG